MECDELIKQVRIVVNETGNDDDVAAADDLAQLGVDLGDPCILDGLDLGVGAGPLGDQLGGDGTLGGDGHLADGTEVLTGLGQDDGVAVLVGNFLHGDGGMAVAVDEGIQAGGIGDQLLGGPGLGSGIVAQVTQSNDIVSFVLDFVDGLLHISVQSSTIFTAGNTVNILPFFILEISRCRFCKCLRCCDTNECNLLIHNGEGVTYAAYEGTWSLTDGLLDVQMQMFSGNNYLDSITQSIIGTYEPVIDADGWLHTGDLACRRPDGNYNITGRLKDMIIRGGENIYPKEIEEFIYTCPKVRDVQVIGVPDEQYGEEIMACIILKDGEEMTVEEMKDFVRAHMARHKVPRYVEFVSEFPMNAAGKILKYKMREAAAEKYGLKK